MSGARLDLLVRRFDALLRRDLGAACYAEAIAANRIEPDARVCHTHDYIDANMTMAEAFTALAGHEVDTDSDADCGLWSAAWAEWIRRTNAGEMQP